MVPLINIAMRGARAASIQIINVTDKLDLMHTDSDIAEQLSKWCQAVERTLAYDIIQAHPNQAVVGHFSGALNTPAKPDSKRWCINALDGIEQYAHGLPMYCLTMVCYQHDQPIHSIIINPATGEEFCASKGRGAKLNDRRIRVSGRTHMAGAQVYGGMYDDMEVFAKYQRVQTSLYRQTVKNYQQMSPCLALSYVASGCFDGLWHYQLNSSVDAGLLLVQEAGGLVCDFAGGKALTQGQLVCANAKFIKLLIKAIHQAVAT